MNAVVPGEPVARRERRPANLRGFVVFADGSAVDVQLTDLSYDGCGVSCPDPLKVGEKLKLSILRRGAIEAEVRWSEAGRAGLVFAPEKREPEKPHWPRRSNRVSLDGEVKLRRLGQHSYQVRVRDLSPEGCKVDLVERPRVDEHLFVKFDGLEALDAIVCWVDDSFCAGVNFVKPLHPAVFDLLVARLKG